jgi:hypothetical protein
VNPPAAYGNIAWPPPNPWIQLKTASVLFDPAASLDTGTGFATDGSGLITVNYKSGMTQLDGARENVPRYQYPIQQLLPGFDPRHSGVEFLVDMVTFPANTVLDGFAVGVADRSTTDLANIVGCFGFCAPLAATPTFRFATMSATAMTNAVTSTTAQAMRVLVQFFEASTFHARAALCTSDAVDRFIPITNGAFTSMSPLTANWHLVLAFPKQSGVATAITNTAKVYYRQVRFGRTEI